MGMYTEFYFKAKLKKDTPKEVLSSLDVIRQHSSSFDLESLPKHSFFNSTRWISCLKCCNFDPEKYSSSITTDKNGYHELKVFTEFKNYDSEIEKFIDWISPYVVGRKKKQYVGYNKINESNQRFNLYILR